MVVSASQVYDGWPKDLCVGVLRLTFVLAAPCQDPGASPSYDARSRS